MRRIVANDLATVWSQPTKGSEVITVLHLGDRLEAVEVRGDWTKVGLSSTREGWIHRLRYRDDGVLEVAFIDVGQGDACLVTTPSEQTILVDGGETQQASRYLAARFGTEVCFDAIVVSHGDADHFAGLSTLVLDAASDQRPRKRIRASAKRVFHNGLVKRGGTSAEIDRLGPTIQEDGRILVPVVEDPRQVSNPNRPFAKWQRALDELSRRGPTEVRRLDFTSSDAFAFVTDFRIDVLGPFTHRAADGRTCLEMLPSPTAPSSAQTINGHSLVLMLTHGNVRVLLTGDINEAAEAALVHAHWAGQLDLRSDVFKVPHHGSDDVSRSFVEAVQPLISIVSAGDESARKDYLHPRANLLGILGRANRGAEPVIFVTNLAAFDRWAGRAFRASKTPQGWEPDLKRGTFYARERTTYGIVHIRTDGERLLVVRRGARADRHEAYAFVLAEDGGARSVQVERT